MTINVSSRGQTRTISDVDVVEDAFQAVGCDPRDLNPGFIPYWLSQGKNVHEILAIAGEYPRQSPAQTLKQTA